MSQLTLVLKEPDEAGDDEEGAVKTGSGSRLGVMSMLAGVLKFNQSLKRVCVADTGLDDAAGAFFATALLENKTLQELDVSNNPIGTTGVADIAAAAREHPAIVSLKTDGAALPIGQLRGAKGAEGNFARPQVHSVAVHWDRGISFLKRVAGRKNELCF